MLQSLDGSDYVFQGIITSLVKDDPALLKALLGNESLRSMHLEPLRGKPDGPWVAAAQLALEAGYTAEDVVEASYSTGYSWTGNLSAMWQEWEEAFAELEGSENPRIAEVGHLGREQAKRRREQAFKEERDREVFGR